MPLPDALSWLTPYLPTQPIGQKALALVALLVVAWVVGKIAQWILTRVIRRFVARTEVTWDDVLVKHHVFLHLSRLAPAAVLYYGVGLIDLWLGDAETATGYDVLVQIVRSAAAAFAVLMVVVAVSSLLNVLNDLYTRREDASARPIKGYIQLLQIALYVFGGVLVLATLMNRSPAVLLGGLGALTAVLLIVFKDTILSLVASLQLNTNDMVRVGDWVEMPSQGVDGDVVDIALHTVKVQNFDNTVTTVPTYAFITDAFKNWRAMHDSGGRRIKRPIYFDFGSIRFLSDDEVADLERFEILRPYLAEKREQLETANRELESEQSPQARRLTNIGTFRAYAVAYLENHPQVNKDLRILVRQLDPTPKGLPVQFYFFTATTDWGVYEGIQSDIFDHFFAITGEFGLRIFQEPSGADWQQLRGASDGTFST